MCHFVVQGFSCRHENVSGWHISDRFYAILWCIRPVTEVTVASLGLEPAKTEVNIQEWGLRFRAPKPLRQPRRRHDIWCVWTTCAAPGRCCSHYTHSFSWRHAKLSVIVCLCKSHFKYSVGPGHLIPVHRATRLYLKRSVLGAGNGCTVILTVFIKYFLYTFLQRRQSASDGVRSQRRWPNVKNSSSTWTKLLQKKVYQWLSWVVLMEALPTFVWRSSKTIRLTSWHWTVDVFMKQEQA